ncbi:MAG: Flp pilus assembly complex ATPase component TadA [Myxococcota bacterium]|jgi:general secretion pathway protein E|nr:Flp pilus assembly complex ATPase component TadA [Myxococcota bacterium]
MRTHSVTLEELLSYLIEDGLLSQEQAAEVRVRADAQAARLTIAAGRQARQRSAAAPSYAEVVASFRLNEGGEASRPLLEEDRIVRCLSAHVDVPYEKLDPLKLDAQLITSTVSLPFARRTSVLPLRRQLDTLVVAASDPFDAHLVDELTRLVSCKVQMVLSARSDIQRHITEVYGFKRSVARAAVEMAPSVDLGNLEQLVRLGKMEELEATDRHVISAVDYLLHYAFDQRASDIHIEPKRETCQIRMRIDGVLHDIYSIPRAVHPAIVNRIKTLSRLDLAERRRPQDGRFKTHKENEEVEMRVSTLPVAFGEKVVVRIFDPGLLIQDVVDLGFEPEGHRRFIELVSRPSGLVLITGPTGSGKTTTLYSALKWLASPEINITTIEDPIEMVVDTFNQIAVQPKIGLDFAEALRHVLRQDPDIIMVGEIRDPETASQALQAALTGHLVLATLHTNDTATSVTRLLELGLNPYVVASTLAGVVAQRLVRKVCDSCRAEVELSPEQIATLNIELPPERESSLRAYEGQGCVRCRGTGLYGRTGVFELLRVTDSIRKLVLDRADAVAIGRAARADGTWNLREDAVRKLALGITSLSEVMRVTLDEDR